MINHLSPCTSSCRTPVITCRPMQWLQPAYSVAVHDNGMVCCFGVLLWCAAMVHCCGVLLWCVALVCCYGCIAMVCCYGALLWCAAMVHCYGVLLWCIAMVCCYCMVHLQLTFSIKSANSLTALFLPGFLLSTAISFIVSCKNFAICSFIFNSFFLRSSCRFALASKLTLHLMPSVHHPVMPLALTCQRDISAL